MCPLWASKCHSYINFWKKWIGSVHFTVCNLQCLVFSVKCIVCRRKCTVCDVQFTVSYVQCTLCNVLWYWEHLTAWLHFLPFNLSASLGVVEDCHCSCWPDMQTKNKIAPFIVNKNINLKFFFQRSMNGKLSTNGVFSSFLFLHIFHCALVPCRYKHMTRNLKHFSELSIMCFMVNWLTQTCRKSGI